MEAPLWTYPLTVVPLLGFCIVIGTGVGWWVAAAIFVPALILIVLATVIGLRRKAERRHSQPGNGLSNTDLVAGPDGWRSAIRTVTDR